MDYPQLLESWRGERSATTGALLCLLGDAVADARGPVLAGLSAGQDPSSAQMEALAAVATAADPADTRRLAEAAFQLPRWSGIALWDLLVDRLPDPNATAVLIEVLATHPSRWMEPPSEAFWERALRWIEMGADQSALAGLDAAAHAVHNAREGRFELDARLRRQLPDLQTTLRTRLELDPPREDPRLQAALNAARPDPVDERLWAACMQNPADLDARTVLRDALLDAGDVRGRALAERNRDWRRYHPRWAGPLAPVLDLDECRFDGPFLVEARLDSDARPLPWVGEASWRTVERLDGTDWAGSEALFVGPGAKDWPVLHTLVGVSGDALKTDGLPALRHVEERLHAESFTLRDVRQPLQTLVLGATAQHRAGALDPTAPVFATLRHLVLLRGHHRWLNTLPDWLEQIPTGCVVELPPSSIDLQLPWHIVLPAREHGTTVELAWHSALPPSTSQLDAVVPLLRAAATWRLRGPQPVRDALNAALRAR